MPNPFWPTAQLVPVASRVPRRLLPFTAHAGHPHKRRKWEAGPPDPIDAPRRAASSQGTPTGPVAAPSRPSPSNPRNFLLQRHRTNPRPPPPTPTHKSTTQPPRPSTPTPATGSAAPSSTTPPP